VAHHSCLVFDVLGTSEVAVAEDPEPPTDDDHAVVQALYSTWSSISRRNVLEPFHDAIQYRDESNQLFTLGYLDLAGRARAEELFHACCTRLRRLLKDLPRVPEEIQVLQKALADTYYCNFSVFQSLPDSWAVGQLFRTMPIHRLHEQPKRQATLADLTCDSDGKLDSFIDIHDVRDVIDLHTLNGGPYYLGVFLVGAYQEVLGDLHNLFGDTNCIYVELAEDRYRVKHVEGGDAVSEVLAYMEFDKRDLLQRVRKSCEDAMWHTRITPEETALLLKRYEEGLNSYTYLASRPSLGDAQASAPPAAALPPPAPAPER